MDMATRVTKRLFVPRLAALSAGAAIVTIAASCTTVPDTGRKALSIVPDSQVVQMGLTEFEKYKRTKPISRDASMNAQSARVARRLTPVIPLAGAQWEFVVFVDEKPNAFALPGGKVGLHTGIFRIARTDGQLAAVVGHEIAHVVARHGNERMSQGLLAALGGAALDVALRQGDLGTGERAGVLAAYGAGATMGVILPFSRKQELEADRLGMLYMARAGFDPNEAVRFWENFADYKARQGGTRTPEFLSTHPLDARRIESLRAFLPEAMAVYRGGRSGGGSGAGQQPAGAPVRALPFNG